MKFLEELKAAQEVIKSDINSANDWNSVLAVLRRIPQLIEVVEMIEAYASLSKAGVVLNNKCAQRQYFAVDILSKLEGKK